MEVKFHPQFKESFDKLFSNELRYVIPRWFYACTKGLYREVKWFIQRGKRGWADSDSWNVDSYLSKIIPPMIRRIKDKGISHPYNLTPEQWQEILEKIAVGFEAIEKIDELEYDDKYKKREKELRKKHEEGMRYFVQYFGSLWD